MVSAGQAIVLAVCLLLMVVTAAVGHTIQTSGGSVRTQEVEFTTDVGASSHAKLYVPSTATADAPAPAIVLCHGYTASLDAMEPNAIELSRRGYVVLALDMYGHGHSSLPPDGYSRAEMGGVENYAPDLGSYSALQELAKYDFIDLTKVGMLGHSMGTASIQEGAYLAYAKWTAVYNAAPVNICTVQGWYDEFSGLLWGVKDSRHYTESFKFAYGIGGATNVPSGTYFMYGDASAVPLSREDAVTAAASAALTMAPIRAAYSFNGTHSDTYYDETAIS